MTDTHTEDRRLSPKYVVVYVSPTPMPAFEISRTRARSFETKEEMLTFLRDTDIETLLGAWELGEPIELQMTTKTVRRSEKVSEWGEV